MAKSDKPKKSKGKSGLAPALERSPGHLLQRAAQLAADAYAREAGPDAVTQRQYAVLAAVAGTEAPSQSDLVRLTGIDRSTLADMAARMITKGLLERARSSTDGRANVVRLSEAGRAALGEATPWAEAADKRLLSALGAGKRDAFVNALAKLTRAEMKDAAIEEVEAPAEPKKGKKKDKKRTRSAENGDEAAPFEPAKLVAPSAGG